METKLLTQTERNIKIARKTIKEIGIQRGYTITDEKPSKILFTDSNNKIIICFICDLPKLNIDSVKEYLKILEDNNISHCIIIYQETITASSNKVIENYFDKEIETFCVKELQSNITKHCLYSVHEKLIDDKEIKKKFGKKFPILLRTDPVAKFFNFKKDDIIKITRKNNFISYRMVK